MKCRECPWFNAKYPNYCYTLSEPITPSKDICADMETFAEKFSENIISENARLRKVVEAARKALDSTDAWCVLFSTIAELDEEAKGE